LICSETASLITQLWQELEKREGKGDNVTDHVIKEHTRKMGRGYRETAE
jgi:hypothetical protein